MCFFVPWVIATAHLQAAQLPAIARASAPERGPLSEILEHQVRPRPAVPDATARGYVVQMDAALETVHAVTPAPKFVVVIDHNTQVQAAILFLAGQLLSDRELSERRQYRPTCPLNSNTF